MNYEHTYSTQLTSIQDQDSLTTSRPHGSCWMVYKFYTRSHWVDKYEVWPLDPMSCMNYRWMGEGYISYTATESIFLGLVLPGRGMIPGRWFRQGGGTHYVPQHTQWITGRMYWVLGLCLYSSSVQECWPSACLILSDHYEWGSRMHYGTWSETSRPSQSFVDAGPALVTRPGQTSTSQLPVLGEGDGETEPNA